MTKKIEIFQIDALRNMNSDQNLDNKSSVREKVLSISGNAVKVIKGKLTL